MVSTQRYKQTVNNMARRARCCLGRLLEGSKASEEKVKQQQCPKALFKNLKTHSKTGFPQTGETQSCQQKNALMKSSIQSLHSNCYSSHTL